MAATDQTYRNQKALDAVFGVSSLLLLATTIWMFADDYNREWKTEQRAFRDVEAAMFTRQAVADLPDLTEFAAVKEKVEKAKEKRKSDAEKIKEHDREIKSLLPQKESKEQKAADVKSLVESRTSFLNIAREANAPEEIKTYEAELKSLQEKLEKAQQEVDEVIAKLKKAQRERDALEKPLSEAQTKMKRLTDDLLRKARTAVKKEWGFADWFRSLPILDGFASPTRIHQFTLNELTLDYNFKNVTRFDRCMTCHQGIDRAAFTKDRLKALRDVPSDLAEKLKETKDVLKDLRKTFAGTPDESTIPNPDSLNLRKLPESDLTDGRVTEFAAHPRLDLFVGSNSKHPAEKFGCTGCHSGQGSATDFYWASHTPNDSVQMKEWKKEHSWGKVHYWDWPMHPKRFIESSCVKCHHQLTDLITTGNHHEAPKLLRGYNLIRENGCYGCHEIPGTKNGQAVGPDMRLEPYPALELLPAGDREKALADKDNLPGNLRKVGPSLFRLSEKTNPDWTAKWIKSPRSFRPDTRMPHFYGLSNNNEAALAGTGQEKFPDAEVAGITYYLFTKSREYLQDIAKLQADKVEGSKKDQAEIDRLTALLADRGFLSTKTNREKDDLRNALERVKVNLARRSVAPPLRGQKEPAAKGDAVRGRKLFTERGCLACHNHAGTAEAQGNEGEPNFIAAAPSVAHFGPTLSQVKAKLGTVPEDGVPARTWLIHWITNPQAHSPRTRMPVTHLEPQEAADVAAWLLSQEPTGMGKDWEKLKVEPPDETALQKLAEVYLTRILSRQDMKEFFAPKSLLERKGELPQDEQDFVDRLANTTGQKRKEAMLWYVGRKAVGRLGCFGCHDVLGFENTKPVGTQLNEWGKKDPGRLAFENINNYLKEHHVRVDDWHDTAKIAEAIAEHKEKTPYEGFFWEALTHQTRDGYLHQKIKEPRSYDYKLARGGVTLAWDDRSRMPQFKFANPRPRKKETKEEFDARAKWQKGRGWNDEQIGKKPRVAETPLEFAARQEKEEADAREAVMTFVLGLIGDAMPTQYLNTPPPDRLAEVKGRQVLDKFNCAGCHNIGPGTFEFRVSKDWRKQVKDQWHRLAESAKSTDYDFMEHYIWADHKLPGDVLLARGVQPQLKVFKNLPTVKITLSQALPYRDAGGNLQTIRGQDNLGILGGDLVFPPPEVLDSPESFHHFMEEQGPFGGRFADLLSKYLMDQDPKKYPDEGGSGDNGRARASAPPPLMNQGERTQPDWLFRFLRDPPRVRRLTVLRMPRFNLSDDDARALVNYFAAVDRRNNPGIGLEYPYARVPQREDLSKPYWLEKTAAYVKELEAAKVYDKLVEEMKPVWEQVVHDKQTQAKDAEARLKAAEAKLEKLKAAEKEVKDDKQKPAAEQARKDAEQAVDFLAGEAKRLKDLASETNVKDLEKTFRTEEAYAHGGYRVLTKVCASCHEIGPLQPSPTQLQGPSLNLSADRLRPGWLKRWIAFPQRYLPYSSSMPQNFPNTPNDRKFLEHIRGKTPLDQVIGIRDTLINLPNVRARETNRVWLLTGGLGEKK